MKVLLGVTGSVATVLLEKLGKALLEAGHEVQIVMTGAAKYFYESDQVRRDCNHRKEDDVSITSPSKWSRVKVWTDMDEWFRRETNIDQYQKNDPIPHIDLGKWADVLLVAPLSANTLEKFANGGCDNLMTCLFRAWDPEKPIVLAPAMNTRMWEHPSTDEHVRKVMRFNHPRKSRGQIRKPFHISFIDPVKKKLACGDEGIGAMAPIEEIVRVVNALVTQNTTEPVVTRASE